MQKFIVSTDSTADLYADYVREHDVRLAPLTFTIEKGGAMTEYLDAFTDYSQYVDFFQQLREKAMPKTSMLNYESHYNHFKKMAEEGAKDVLHFTISTGLASTINVARQAAADVKKEYPEFNLKAVDSLAATIGQGELVYEAVRLRDAARLSARLTKRCRRSLCIFNTSSRRTICSISNAAAGSRPRRRS